MCCFWQPPWLLPGASPQPVKIQPHKSSLPLWGLKLSSSHSILYQRTSVSPQEQGTAAGHRGPRPLRRKEPSLTSSFGVSHCHTARRDGEWSVSNRQRWKAFRGSLVARCQHPPEPPETGGFPPAKPPGAAVEGGRRPTDYAVLPDPRREPKE